MIKDSLGRILMYLDTVKAELPAINSSCPSEEKYLIYNYDLDSPTGSNLFDPESRSIFNIKDCISFTKVENNRTSAICKIEYEIQILQKIFSEIKYFYVREADIIIKISKNEYIISLTDPVIYHNLYGVIKFADIISNNVAIHEIISNDVSILLNVIMVL